MEKEKKDNRSIGKRRAHSEGINLLAQVISVDDGIPVKRSAEIVNLTSSGAIVKATRPFQPGQKIVLVIQDVERGLFDMFDLNGSASSLTITIKTQAEVTEIRELYDHSDGCLAEIRFIGNIKVSNNPDGGRGSA